MQDYSVESCSYEGKVTNNNCIKGLADFIFLKKLNLNDTN